MDVGSLVRRRRKARGLSQAQLAHRAGTAQPTLSRIENGHESPTLERLVRLLHAMGDELDIGVRSLDPERPVADLAADRAKSVSERLEEGFALAAFATELAGKARR